jgi:hypothetical protein
MQFQEIFRISDRIGPFSCKLDRTTANNFRNLEMSSFLSNNLRLRNFSKALPHAFTNNIYFDLHPMEQEQWNFEIYLREN